MSGRSVDWPRVQRGITLMILGGVRPILSLTFDDVRRAASDQTLSDEFCAEVLNVYTDNHRLSWREGIAALVKSLQ